MSEVKPKKIKPGKRGYAVEEIADNISQFLELKSCGKIEMRVHNRQVVHIGMFGMVEVINSPPTVVDPTDPPLRVYSIDDVTANVKHFLKENSFGSIQMRILDHQIVEFEMWGAMDVIRKSLPDANQSRISAH